MAALAFDEPLAEGWDLVADDANGRISYTMRELLDRIDARLSSIDEKLDGKADMKVVHGINERLILLETQAVLRDGPIVADMRKFERAVDEMQSAMLTQAQVKQALRDDTNRRWTTRERVFAIVGLVCVVVGAIGTVVSIYVAAGGQ